jgi:hypothetical protein
MIRNLYFWKGLRLVRSNGGGSALTILRAAGTRNLPAYAIAPPPSTRTVEPVAKGVHSDSFSRQKSSQLTVLAAASVIAAELSRVAIVFGLTGQA